MSIEFDNIHDSPPPTYISAIPTYTPTIPYSNPGPSQNPPLNINEPTAPPAYYPEYHNNITETTNISPNIVPHISNIYYDNNNNNHDNNEGSHITIFWVVTVVFYIFMIVPALVTALYSLSCLTQTVSENFWLLGHIICWILILFTALPSIVYHFHKIYINSNIFNMSTFLLVCSITLTFAWSFYGVVLIIRENCQTTAMIGYTTSNLVMVVVMITVSCCYLN